MSPQVLFIFVLAYFFILLLLAWLTSRNSNNESFYVGNRNSNWMLVAFGMIGTSLSGVTFISVPGTVGVPAGDVYKGFLYFQVVIGYIFGYLVIAFVLLPLYYRLNLTSIYHFLEHRFGRIAYKTGAVFFILSRTVGATARLFLVINVMQLFILDDMGVPFVVTTMIILVMILLYTYRGGVKTIVYTDTLQTIGMLTGLVVCVIYILHTMDIPFGDAWDTVRSFGYTRIWDTHVQGSTFFLKQVLGGMFIAIAMTGLDQEMMQKNISIKTVQGAQKNMMTFTTILVIVNFLFLLLGGLLYMFIQQQGGAYTDGGLMYAGKNIMGDALFPTVALHIFPPVISIIFIIALISALFPSADGALTALTSSFCIDLLGLQRRKELDEKGQKRIRMTVHFTFAFVFLLCILIFKWIDDNSIIGVILDLAGYTYGPLLGLFAFGVLTKRVLPNHWTITAICLGMPLLCYLLKYHGGFLLGDYQIGLELLLLNGILTFIGLWIISHKQKTVNNALDGR
ncbi:MAG: sodium:solute symporter [Chitinophagales bacterium]